MRYLIIFILVGILLVGARIFAAEVETHFQKGHRFYLESKPTEAEAEFKKALRLNPQLSDAHYYLASIYFKQDRFAEAKKECEDALKINPNELNCLIILGLSVYRLGLDEQAIRVFQRACEVESQSAAAHSALGLVYCAKGELLKAKEEYEILKKIDSGLANDLWQEIKRIQRD